VPLVDVLREKVRGIQATILKDLQAARDMVVERKAGDGHGGALGEPFHALYPAAVIALISALLTLIVVHGQEMLKIGAGKAP
jgi:hypothetical protein